MPADPVAAPNTREWAIRISDALVASGQTHSIVVSIHDHRMPRETYAVNIMPVLAFSELDITALQRLADSLGAGIAYWNGSFTFVGGSRAR